MISGGVHRQEILSHEILRSKFFMLIKIFFQYLVRLIKDLYPDQDFFHPNVRQEFFEEPWLSI